MRGLNDLKNSEHLTGEPLVAWFPGLEEAEKLRHDPHSPCNEYT